MNTALDKGYFCRTGKGNGRFEGREGGTDKGGKKRGAR